MVTRAVARASRALARCGTHLAPWPGRQAALSAKAGGCVCGLSPCLAPSCAAMNWDAWSGTFTADVRSLAPYQGTPEAVTAALLSLAELRPGETLVDLGAGDGRVLLHAVERFDAGAAIGFELDPAIHALAVAHVAARFAGAPHLARRVTLHCADARDAQLAGSHVVALYLLPAGHAALAPHLAAQLPRGCGTRVVAHGWPVPDWAADAEAVTTMGTRLYLYRR